MHRSTELVSMTSRAFDWTFNVKRIWRDWWYTHFCCSFLTVEKRPLYNAVILFSSLGVFSVVLLVGSSYYLYFVSILVLVFVFSVLLLAK